MAAALPAGLGRLLDFDYIADLPRSVSDVADAVAQRAAQGGGRTIVFGHSINGLLALATAALHPDAVSGVIAVCAPPRWPLDGDAVQRYWDDRAEPERKAVFQDRAALVAAAGTDDERRQRWQRADAVRRWHDLAFDPAALDSLATGDMTAILSILEDAATKDWTALLTGVRCPVFLALGSSDFIVPPPSWAGGELPAAALSVRHFDRSGHTPFYEEPDAFVAAVADWLERTVLGAL